MTSNFKISCNYCKQTLFASTFISHIEKHHKKELLLSNKHIDFTDKFTSSLEKINFGCDTDYYCCFPCGKLWALRGGAERHYNIDNKDCKNKRIQMFKTVVNKESPTDTIELPSYIQLVERIAKLEEIIYSNKFIAKDPEPAKEPETKIRKKITCMSDINADELIWNYRNDQEQEFDLDMKHYTDDELDIYDKWIVDVHSAKCIELYGDIRDKYPDY